MKDEHIELLMGIIILILIVDTISIFSMVPGINIHSSSPTLVTSVVTPTQVPIVDGTPLQTAALSPIPIPTPVPIVNNAQSPVFSATPLQTAPSSPPIPAQPGYVNIYKIHEIDLNNDKVPPILINLINPPLIIDFDVKAINITDIKYFEYKQLSTYHQDSVPVTRPYEEARFSIKVTENNSSRLIAEDGYGKEYGLLSPGKMIVMERGNYTISLSGMFVNVSVSMEVPKEFNVIE